MLTMKITAAARNIVRRPGGVVRAGSLAATGAGLVLLASACGGGSATSPPAATSPSAGSSDHQHALEYTSCMRSHGLPNFPDPNSDGTFSGLAQQGIGPNSPQFQKANAACQSLYGPAQNSSQQAQAAATDLKYSVCMRSHGDVGFPDPDSQGGFSGGGSNSGGGSSSSSAEDPDNPVFQAANKKCQSILGASLQRGGQ
jgi:hypothetical protein